MIKRVLFDLLLLSLIFFVSWWTILVLIAVGVFKFPAYFEAILFGVIIDLLYGTVVSFGSGVIGLFSALFVFIVMVRVKYAVRPAYSTKL